MSTSLKAKLHKIGVTLIEEINIHFRCIACDQQWVSNFQEKHRYWQCPNGCCPPYVLGEYRFVGVTDKNAV